MVKCVFPTKINILPAIMEHLDVKHATVIDKSYLNSFEQIELFKVCSKHGKKIHFNNSHHDFNKYQPLVLFSELQKIHYEKYIQSRGLVISNIQNENDLEHIDLQVDSELFFLDWKSLKIYESYMINQIHISKYLGQFQILLNSNTTKSILSFIKTKDYISSMIKRRGNFYGVELSGMYDIEYRYINMYPKDFETKVKYFPNNETYDMTEVASGVYIDVLHSVERILNFSTKLYKRKDGKWGVPKKLDNGTVVCNK